MKYDFDTVIDRRFTHCLKWDVAEGELPMWVADMDFATAPEVRQAIERRAAHGIFGYQDVSEEWYRAYIGWWKRRHGLTIEKDWLIFCTGVVPAISSMVRKLTTPAEKVLIQTPVYNIFFNSILNNGRQVLESPLSYDGEQYRIDFADLEEKLADPQTSLMILCNPHNPTGKIWSREELAHIGELCDKYHVTVISDEIHCDLTDPGCSYVPFASVSETCKKISITCMAPTKAFNLAGIQTAAVAAADETLRHKVWRGLNTDEVAEPNAFAVDAAVAAFTEGEPWLEELREYLSRNKKFVRDFIKQEIPQIHVVPSEATYLLWLDCGRLLGNENTDYGIGKHTLPEPADPQKTRLQTAGDLARVIRERTGLYLSAGGQFGGNGNQFLRMNTACSRTILEDGLKRLKSGVTDLEAAS